MLWNKAKKLLLSKTAINTYVLFMGNLADAIFAFLFTVISFRLLSTENFGTFSAINNFVVLLFSLMDLGVSSSLINFIAQFISLKKPEMEEKYQYSGIAIRLSLAAAAFLLILVFSPWISKQMFMTTEYLLVVLAGMAIFGLSGLDVLFFALQAKSKFWQSAISSIAYSLSRVLILLFFIILGGKYSIGWAMVITATSPFLGMMLGGYLLGFDISKLKIEVSVLKKMLSFGGWMGMMKILTSIAGRIDVQIILWMSGAFQAGVYSVATRLASFYPVVIASFMAVIAPRLAANMDHKQLKQLMSKSGIGIFGLVLIMGLGVLIANPLMLILFGTKAQASVLPFQLLTIAFMPFMISSLAVSVIIYHFKQPKVVCLISALQLIVILVGGFIWTNSMGANGIVLAIGVSNLLMMVLSYFYLWKKWRRLEY